MDRRFRLVDVFGVEPLTGNPLAVVVDSQGMGTDEMLELTRWLNFSETTFLLPPEAPEADYRVRIFTLAGELPFAGHPRLGTCHVWASVAGESRDEIVQECGAGLIRIRRTEDRYAFEAPGLERDGPIDEDYLSVITEVLGVNPSDVVSSRWVDNGPGWAGILLNDADAVLELEPDFARNTKREKLDIGVVGFHEPDSATRYEVRAFFSGQGGKMIEDPVTGSLNASVAQWMLSEERVEAPYVAAQGTALGRCGRIHISTDPSGSVWVRGRVFDIVSGEI